MADTNKPDPESEPVAEEITDAILLDEPKADDERDKDTLPDEPVAEPETVEPEATPERVAKKRSVFVPAVLGGIVAAGLGFAVAKSDLLESYFPNSKADQAITELRQTLADQSKQIAALKEQVSGLKIPVLSGVETQMTDLSSQISPLSTSIKGLESQLTTLNTSLTTLSDRITTVEKRPISEGVSQSAIDAYENELKRLQASMVTQRTKVESMIEAAKAVESDANKTRADAADVLQVAANKALLAKLREELQSGSPYANVLSELTTNGVKIPGGLSASAATGVTTLAALQGSYPEAARAALAVARDATKTTDTGIAAFFRRQLGARSVSPRDGDSADAILSRAEAALTNGQVSDALDELANLPDDVNAAMADWIEPAKTRQAAIAASDALGRELNTK